MSQASTSTMGRHGTLSKLCPNHRASIGNKRRNNFGSRHQIPDRSRCSIVSHSVRGGIGLKILGLVGDLLIR